VGRRWRDPCAVWCAVPRRAGARADGAADRAGGVPVRRRGAPAALFAGRAERVRALAWADGGVDHRQLRLSDRAFPSNTRYRGSGRLGRSAVMSPGRIASLRNPWFTASAGITAGIAIVAAVVGFVWL